MSYTHYEPELAEDERVIMEHLGGSFIGGKRMRHKSPARRHRSRSKSASRRARSHSRGRMTAAAILGGKRRETPAMIERKIISLEKKLEKALRK